VVALTIPGVNDFPHVYRDIASSVLNASGPNTPLHFTRFYPAYKMTNLPPTPIAALEEAREVGVKEGLRYVYLGNVPGHPFENTYCHSCGRLLIQRYGFYVVKNKLRANCQCPRCRTNIPVITA
ncbi:MAG: AmmeMemoRadiSam system radical SAM enzyme, partial [Candidatus Bathyarchaeia archaeon]